MLTDFLDKEIVYIGLGSNMGDRVSLIRKAEELIRKIPRINVLEVSSLYETEPVDMKSDDWFINCIVAIETDLACFELLFILQEIETTMGRKKSAEKVSRPIDIDILVWENRVLGSESLCIPHSELHKRKFILIPLDEINANMKIPKHNMTPQELLDNLEGEDARYEIRIMEDKIDI